MCLDFPHCSGALFVRSPSEETPLFPILFGGGQERGFRAGTENTGMIAGLGEAAQLVLDNLDEYSAHMKKVVPNSLKTPVFHRKTKQNKTENTQKLSL